MLTPNLCRTARSLLQWTCERLAREAGIEVTALTAFELDSLPCSRATIARITGALEAAGIVFVSQGHGETTVTLRR